MNIFKKIIELFKKIFNNSPNKTLPSKSLENESIKVDTYRDTNFINSLKAQSGFMAKQSIIKTPLVPGCGLGFKKDIHY